MGLSSAAAASPAARSGASRSTSFTRAQLKLEQQLADRAGELSRLTADVHGSATLTVVDAATLTGRLSTETANIAALQAQVPGYNTFAELATARTAMYRDNRVYAVMAPQVFEVIEADSIAAEVTTMRANEASLQAAVTSLVGQSGYRTAAAHYEGFVSAVNEAAGISARIDARVIAEMPSNYPGSTRVFVFASHRLFDAQIDLAHASYDESIIGLASGGVSGT